MSMCISLYYSYVHISASVTKKKRNKFAPFARIYPTLVYHPGEIHFLPIIKKVRHLTHDNPDMPRIKHTARIEYVNTNGGQTTVVPSTPHKRRKKSRRQPGYHHSIPNNPPTSRDTGDEDTNKEIRYRPGTVALRKIERYQGSTDERIFKEPFGSLVREIAVNIEKDTRFKSTALLASQEASEYFLIHMMEDKELCPIQSKRVPIMPEDMNLVKTILYGQPSK